MLVKEKVFERVSDPAVEQMRNALMIYCFVVEKRDGRIKARAVADGRGTTKVHRRRNIISNCQARKYHTQCFHRCT